MTSFPHTSKGLYPLRARGPGGSIFKGADVPLAASPEKVHISVNDDVDFVSPVPVGLAYVTPINNCLSPGPQEAPTGLIFAVDENAGAFEIDTAFYPPSLNFALSPCNPSDEIVPGFAKGIVTLAVTCGCDCHCDPACDHLTNVLDVVYAANVTFRGADDVTDPDPQCPYTDTDADGNGCTDVIDVVKFVNVAFRGGTAEDNFCDPCP